MEKTFKNIISNKIVSFARYIVIGEYSTQKEAEVNLEKDVQAWKNRNKDNPLYKQLYPFAWATISE